MTSSEVPVTAEDVREKWEAVERTIKSKVEQRVLGMSYLTWGSLVFGAGALGAAYWLGRRSASQYRRPAPQPGESFVGLEAPQLAGRPREDRARRLAVVLEPVVDRMLCSAVEAVSQRIQPRPANASRR